MNTNTMRMNDPFRAERMRVLGAMWKIRAEIAPYFADRAETLEPELARALEAVDEHLTEIARAATAISPGARR